MLLVLAQMASAKTELVSNDPNWLGGRATFNTTEGNDFWLTFMNNGMFNPIDPKNASIQFEMKIAVSAREAMEIIIAPGNATPTTLTLAAGETKIYDLDRSLAETIYLYNSEDENYKGVHVYASQKDKDKYFSCFLYNRAFDSPNTSRDASLVIPTRLLGKEYIIQTYPQDVYSSEFAIVATEDNTVVSITPTFDTDGEHEKDKPFSVTLSRGQAYLVASKKHEEGSKDLSADLTGSRICADKPIAVFNGNQQTGIPNREGTSQDFLVEQVIPVSQWGTEFYLSKLTNTISNYAHITALEDGTNVQIYVGNTPNLIQLDRGKTRTIQLKNANEVIVKADKPLICYDYTTTAAENNVCTPGDLGQEDCYMYGDPSNAMMPAWEHHAQSMTFYTAPLDPQGGASIPQHFHVYVVTKTDDIGKFTLNGTPVAASSFSKFQADATMAYAHIKLPDATERSYHLLETTGEGFVGMVYGITQAQAYFYTLGYNPNPYGDSLFINNTKPLMSAASYDMDSLDGHGWYQRQWNEWVEGKERLDTAVVCDGSTVYWTMETHPDRPVKEIEWNIYDRTTEEEKGEPKIIANGDVTNPGSKYKLERKFELPIEEDMEDRHQFFEYELELILHRAKVFCEGDDDTDTFRTVTRVTRMFNDTIWRAICIGDTLYFFNDSLFRQDDLNQYERGKKDSTAFIATKAGTGYIDKPWNYNVDLGQYSFTRSYQSQFGCDSLITLELFVCDTFRFVDTIHICQNQDTTYHDTTYYGIKFQIKDWYSGKHYKKVEKDTTVQYVRYKTDSCDCQKGEWKDKYKGKDGKKFQGCDSIYELHLYIHPSYKVEVTDTVDYRKLPPGGDTIYVWHTEIDTDGDGIPDQPKDSIIDKRKYSITEYWNRKQQAWIVELADTLYTKTCSECNEGQGCDSINSITVIFPKAYHYKEDTVWCRLSYDWNTHTSVHTDYQWVGHKFGRDHDTIFTQTGDYYDSCVSRYGADSIYHLHLVYSKAEYPLYKVFKDTVCFDSLHDYHWTVWDTIQPGNVIVKRVDTDTIPQDIKGLSYYVDESRCDTIYALELYVLPTYFKVDSIKKTQEETYTWYANGRTYGGAKTTTDQCDTVIMTSEYVLEIDTFTAYVGTRRCDSIHKLVLHFGNVYRDTIDSFACGQETEFVWWETRPEYLPEGEPFIRMTISEADLPKQGKDSIYKKEFKTVLNDDSVFYLNLYRAPIHDSIDSIRVCQAPGATFTWKKHAGHKIYDMDGNVVTSIPAERYSHGNYYEYVDTIPTAHYGCDSIWHLHLYVDSVYHFTYEDTTCQFNTYVWPNQDIDSIDRPIITQHIGDSVYTASYHSIYGCDSIWTLKLHIDTVYKDPVSVTPRYMCDKDTIMIYDLVIYGIKSPLRPEGVGGLEVPDNVKFIEVDTTYTAQTINGCDSLVKHHIQVYKTYADTARIRVGQPSEGRDSLFHWVHHDTVWDVHNSRFIPADSIPRYVKGDTTYLYIDSLRTTACTTCERIKEGCDSLFFLYLTIDSTFHFYDTIHICENEDTTWQKIHFVGDSVDAIDWQPGDSIRKPGIYLDTMRYEAKHACDTCAYDSIYYLKFIITPVYHDVTTYVYCDNDTSWAAHHYTFSDSKGDTIKHYVKFEPHDPRPEQDTASVYYTPRDTLLTDTLVTVDGCDSIVTAHIILKPTYEFQHDNVYICHNGSYEWRGKEYMTQDHYEDKYYTEDGQCDSIFTLNLYIKPVHTTVIYDTICDNETYWYRDTIFYVDGMGREMESITEYPVWSPGDPRPKPYVETTVQGMPPDTCDSLIYRYYLTICNTYNYERDDTLCSGKPFEYTFVNGVTHVWESTAFEYDTNVYVVPFDTLFTDSLQTIMGCDSIFKLYAHVRPSYRHIEYDTICGNDSLSWRDTLLHDLDYGSYIVHDSNYTALYGCDSIYELRLFVYEKYLIPDTDSICVDETYVWRDSLYIHIPAGDNLLYDSLKTIHGCDSVFHMYLHVKDTTNTVHYDTICYGDTLTITETGHIYTVPGDYKDTTLNEWGCHHFIYTHLAQIPPTVPTVWAEDAMCQDTTSFYLYYTYTSHYPIAYSLYFDEAGKSMGFEDMINVPIDRYTDPMFIKVPIPYRDDDPTKYPRPGNYSVRLILDNGICRHKESDCFHDSTFMMSYPSWLTEQRYGDVIALLNEKYNGGYKWSAYQWYQGGKKLVGQTNPYLYIPTGLEDNTEYHVVLTREGEKQSFPTCPITVTYDSRFNQYAPTMGYLDVAPTCVTTGHPYTTILSRHGGRYRVTTSSGSAITSGDFHADATEIQVPSTSGMYIVQLWSDDTPEEPYRAIKIVVKDICETCATSF